MAGGQQPRVLICICCAGGDEMAKESLKRELADYRFFAGLEPEYLEFLARCAREVRTEADHVLFRHGDRAEQFYLLCSGRVCMEVPAISGPSLEIQEVNAGEVLGWSWLIPPYTWSFQGRTLEKCTLLEFDGKAVLERCEQDHHFGYAILKRFSSLMSRRLDAARQQMIDQWNPPGFA